MDSSDIIDILSSFDSFDYDLPEKRRTRPEWFHSENPHAFFAAFAGSWRVHGNLSLVFGALSRQAGAEIVILIWWSRPRLLREIDIKPSGNEWSWMIIAT